ncbi:hypothetical protein N0V83_005100 [Neocucurbitaria cava]|uniref:Uncharacterized protein n=1 Tax=Neocucurbitaria cava TaxID=798079 RepID=A0A9W8YA27_9PLEO|nr:hypothetical protein N0V83_005100 [Neocucurbitaria cava]
MSPLSVPKIFMAGGAVGFGYYLYMRQHWFPNPYKTPAVQSIEDRYSSGGGAPTHLPPMASKRGSATENDGRQHGPSKGPDSEWYKENMTNQPEEPVYPDKFYKQQYGNPKGK